MGSRTSSLSKILDMSSPSAIFVKTFINENKVAIFSKSACPYCKMAKKVFEDMGTAFKAVELNERDDGDEIQDILLQMTGSRTVPRVFVNGTCIGGGTDTKSLFEKGELQKMLAK